MEQITNELHKPIRKVKKFRKVISLYSNEIWALDLVEMIPFAKENNGFKYFITGIDLYSRFAFAMPLKSKTGKDVTEAIQTIIDEYNVHPEKLWVDQGKEFYNKELDQLRKKYNNIEIYSTFGEHKSVMIERFNRTLKSMMYKLFTSNGNREWINILDDLIDKYNNNFHRSIKNKPINIFKSDKLISKNFIDDRDNTKAKFNLGDRVRISYKRGILDQKGYLPNWSFQIYFIDKVLDTNPPTYQLIDEKDEIIKGSFYEPELLKTNQKENIYLVEKILKEKGKGAKKEYLIKWLGYDESFNSWEPASNIDDLKNIHKL
jgi:hypothetical protein